MNRLPPRLDGGQHSLSDGKSVADSLAIVTFSRKVVDLASYAAVPKSVKPGKSPSKAEDFPKGKDMDVLLAPLKKESAGRGLSSPLCPLFFIAAAGRTGRGF